MIRYFGTESLCYTAEINITNQQCCAVLSLVLSCVQLFATLWTEARQAPLSTGIHQARILEWVAILFSRGSSRSRDRTHMSHTAGRFSIIHKALFLALFSSFSKLFLYMISPISMILTAIYMLMASKFIFLAQISLLS